MEAVTSFKIVGAGALDGQLLPLPLRRLRDGDRAAAVRIVGGEAVLVGETSPAAEGDDFAAVGAGAGPMSMT
jgi:hypothetical protein